MHRRAFSLIELLVVIAIISLLVSLLLPALAHARRTARASAGFANLRSVSQVLAVYTNDHGGALLTPFRASWPATRDYAGMTWSKARSQSDPEQQWDFIAPLCPPASTEGFATVWYSYLAEYRGGRRADQEQISPADPELTSQYRDAESETDVREGHVLMPSSFYYPPVFWSRPERFAGACRLPMGPEFLQTAFLSSVTYPSAKVLIFERADFASGRTPLMWFDRSAKTHIALVDGSCDTADMASIHAAAQQSSSADLIPTDTCCGVPPAVPAFFFATYRGVQGRDLPR